MSRYLLNPYDRGPPDHVPPDPAPDCPGCGDPNTDKNGDLLDPELETCGDECCRAETRRRNERLAQEEAEMDAASVRAELEFQAECAANPGPEEVDSSG